MNSWLGVDSLDKLEMMMRGSGMRAHSRLQLALGSMLVLWNLWKAFAFVLWVATDTHSKLEDQALSIVLVNLHVVTAGVRASTCGCVYVLGPWGKGGGRS
jgi:hypothetical protein